MEGVFPVHCVGSSVSGGWGDFQVSVVITYSGHSTYALLLPLSEEALLLLFLTRVQRQWVTVEFVIPNLG